jgi:hypothetical protein
MLRSMSVARIIALYLVGSFPTTAYPASESQPERSCTLDVEGLRYPPDAVSGRIMGTVESILVFTEGGELASIRSHGHPALVKAAEAALHSSRPSGGCSGQQTTMRFDFVLNQDLDPKTPVSVRRDSASLYEIIAPSGWIEVTITDPAWAFTRHGRFFHHLKGMLSHLKLW